MKKQIICLFLSYLSMVVFSSHCMDDLRNLENPLHHLVAGGMSNYDLLSKLLDVNCADEKGMTPVHVASFEGDRLIAELLVNAHATVDARDSGGATPLYLASQNGHLDVVRLLLQVGKADPNAYINEDMPDIGKWTPLHAACANGHGAVVKLLLEENAIVDVKSSRGFTPLHLLSQEGHSSVVKLLLDAHATVDARTNKEGVTPLYLASQNGHLDVVRLLLHIGKADLNAHRNEDVPNAGKWTPLHVACANRHGAVVKLLLEENAIVDVKSSRGFTPLNLIAERNYPGIAQLLLQRRANPNSTNCRGWAPLHRAAYHNKLPIIRILMYYGADATVVTNYGKRAADLTEDNDIKKYLEDPKDNCSICLEELNEENISFLPCGHILCKECRESYVFVHHNSSCPVCRAVN